MTKLFLASSLLGLLLASAANLQAAGCPPVWTALPSPNREIFDVLPFSDDDVWAVDGHVRHWDGTAWNLDSTVHVVYAIGGTPNDLWAVGTKRFHWDGVSWTQFGVPDSNGTLRAVTVIAADDVWAAGRTLDGHALVEHWDGTSWSVSTKSHTGDLQALTAVAPDDIWVFGIDLGFSFIEHWDGSSWTVIPSSSAAELLYGGAATGPANVWAVGRESTGDQAGPFAETWVGGAWEATSVPRVVPRVGHSSHMLFAAHASAWQDVWAAGYWTNGNGSLSPLIEHWDGTAWSIVDLPKYPNMAIRALGEAGTHLWAVGEPGTSVNQPSPIYHLCPSVVTDTGFAHNRDKVPFGHGVVWRFPKGNALAHTVTDASPLALFDSGPQGAGRSFVVNYPGAGTYPLVDTATSSTSEIQVQVAITGTSPMHVSWAAAYSSGDHAFDVQVKRPGESAFSAWITRSRHAAADFVPDAGPGTYVFRARTRRLSTGLKSAWSPQGSQEF